MGKWGAVAVPMRTGNVRMCKGSCHYVGAWVARLRPVSQSKSPRTSQHRTLPRAVGRLSSGPGFPPKLEGREAGGWAQPGRLPSPHPRDLVPGREGKGKSSCFKFWQNRLTLSLRSDSFAMESRAPQAGERGSAGGWGVTEEA